MNLNMNSWSYVKCLLDEIKNDNTRWNISELNNTWEDAYSDSGIARESDKQYTPLESFITYIRLGVYPPPEIITAICH